MVTKINVDYSLSNFNNTRFNNIFGTQFICFLMIIIITFVLFSGFIVIITMERTSS